MHPRGVLNIIAWTVPSIYIGVNYNLFAAVSVFCVLWVITPNVQ